jgi:hypothetical protein
VDFANIDFKKFERETTDNAKIADISPSKIAEIKAACYGDTANPIENHKFLIPKADFTYPASPIAPQPPEKPVLTIEQAQMEIDKTIALLIINSLVIQKPQRKIKDKVLPSEYWLNEALSTVLTELEKWKAKGAIQIGNCETFMKAYLKSQKGHSLNAAFRTEKNIKKRKKT